MVLESADPEYFVPHVDLTKVAEYTAEAAKAGGPEDASLGMLWHKLSELPVVTIAKLRGRARGAGSELALACDMRFAARENAMLGQPEVGFGVAPGAGGVQHLARLMGRGRAMEAILGAADFDADAAERYGWINRALPDAELDEFVARLSRRIASFPAEAVRSTKQVLNELTLPGADAIRADARRFQQLVRSEAVKARMASPVRAGAADPWPARARPRRSPRILVTSLPILKDVRESRVRLASDRRPRNGDSPTRAAVSVHGSHRPGSPAGWCDQTWVREAGFL